MSTPDITKKHIRDRLRRRREPYFRQVRQRCYLGFRRGPDTWIARYRPPGSREEFHAIKGAGIDWSAALQHAEGWFAKMTGTAVRLIVRSSVRHALEAYLEDLRRHGRHGAAKGAEWRFRKYVWGDPLAAIEFERLTRDDMEDWRQRALPGRTARTVERQLRSVKAGLSRAVELGHVGNPAAWKLHKLQDDHTGETAVFLNAAQRAALISAAELQAAHFLRGLQATGSRPGELAAARVADFDGQTLRLVHHKGKPPKPRLRYVVLSAEGVEFFQAMVAGRKPEEPLLVEGAQGTAFRPYTWARRIREAIVHHNTLHPDSPLPVTASAYSFRHSRISELLQLHGVDPLVVAQQTGTSVAIIERAYMKFIPSALREKLAAIRGT